MSIGWNGAQTRVLNWTADGEMIEALPIVASQTERAVQHLSKPIKFTDGSVGKPYGMERSKARSKLATTGLVFNRGNRCGGNAPAVRPRMQYVLD